MVARKLILIPASTGTEKCKGFDTHTKNQKQKTEPKKERGEKKG